MKKENSGKIYKFRLDFELGYGFSLFVDFTDEDSFNGRLLFIFNVITTDEEQKKTINEIVNSGYLFGPVPLIKEPNIKGKDAWKFIDQIENYPVRFPLFKEYGILTEKDWSKIGPWIFRTSDYKNDKRVENYDEVRHLEVPILTTTSGVRVRTTMHILILKGEDVSKYYNLKEAQYWNSYVRIVNTSFSLEKARELLKKIDDKPSIWPS